MSHEILDRKDLKRRLENIMVGNPKPLGDWAKLMGISQPTLRIFLLDYNSSQIKIIAKIKSYVQIYEEQLANTSEIK